MRGIRVIYIARYGTEYDSATFLRESLSTRLKSDHSQHVVSDLALRQSEAETVSEVPDVRLRHTT